MPVAIFDDDGGFSPSQISGLLGYWDFGDAANLAVNDDGSGGAPADTGAIKYCRDLSGLGNHMTERSGVGFPTWAANSINGKGTALFDGNDVLESTANLALPNNQLTIFAVGARAGAGVGLTAFFTGGVTSFSVAGSNWYQIQTPEASDWQLEGSGGNLDLSSTVSYGSRYELFTAVRNGATPVSTLYTGGVQRATAGIAYTLAASGPAFIGDWNSVNGVNANIACILVYDRALTAAEQLQVEVYLADRFGIYHPSATWPRLQSIFRQASILDNTLNHNQIGGATDTLKYLFDGNNIDGLGTSNVSLTDHALIATWDNQGTAGAAGDATQATASAKPTIEKDIESGGNDGVAFGGNGDYLTIGGSQAGLAFVHNTGIFDIVIVGRRDIQDVSFILSSVSGGAQKGFDLVFSAANKVEINISAGATALLELSSTANIVLGSTYTLEFKGSGTVGYVSADLSTFDSTAMGATVAGDATNAALIGRGAADAVNSYDGALFGIGIYTAQLSDAARALLKAGLEARYDV